MPTISAAYRANSANAVNLNLHQDFGDKPLSKPATFRRAANVPLQRSESELSAIATSSRPRAQAPAQDPRAAKAARAKLARTSREVDELLGEISRHVPDKRRHDDTTAARVLLKLRNMFKSIAAFVPNLKGGESAGVEAKRKHDFKRVLCARLETSLSTRRAHPMTVDQLIALQKNLPSLQTRLSADYDSEVVLELTSQTLNRELAKRFAAAADAEMRPLLLQANSGEISMDAVIAKASELNARFGKGESRANDFKLTDQVIADMLADGQVRDEEAAIRSRRPAWVSHLPAVGPTLTSEDAKALLQELLQRTRNAQSVI